MSIGYVIIAHRGPAQVARLVRRLAGPESSFVIHLDRKAGEAPERELRDALTGLERVEMLERRPVEWAHFSLLERMLAGIERACATGPDHVTVLSGQCYPIKSRELVERHLEARRGRSLVPAGPLPRPDWRNDRGGIERIERVHVRLPVAGLQRLPLRQPAPPGLRLYGGSQWVTLAREHARHVVAVARTDRRMMRSFRFAYAGDELFFASVLRSSRFADEVLDENTHFIRWRSPDMPAEAEPSHPLVLRSADIADLERSPALFARKFNAEIDSQILDEIDRRLLGVPSDRA